MKHLPDARVHGHARDPRRGSVLAHDDGCDAHRSAGACVLWVASFAQNKKQAAARPCAMYASSQGWLPATEFCALNTCRYFVAIL